MATGIGLDGCKGGWFYFILNDTAASYGSIEWAGEILDLTSSNPYILIDIPIGLPENPKKSTLSDA